MKLKFNKRLLLIFSYLLVGFLVVVAVKAFTGPTQNPSGGNPAWPKINTVVGTDDVSIDYNGYFLVPNMTYTDTFAAGNVFVTFNAMLTPTDGNNESFNAEIRLDDVMVQRVFLYVRADDGVSPTGPTTISWAGSVSAGSHTIKVMINNGARNSIHNYGTIYPRNLIIMRGFN